MSTRPSHVHLERIVGPTDRFSRIRLIKPVSSWRIVTRAVAESISEAFNRYLSHLRSGGA